MLENIRVKRILPNPVLVTQERKLMDHNFQGNMGTRQLTEKEINEKRAKNECFQSDEKFTPTHWCKNGQFNRIKMVLDEEEYSE